MLGLGARDRRVIKVANFAFGTAYGPRTMVAAAFALVLASWLIAFAQPAASPGARAIAAAPEDAFEVRSPFEPDRTEAPAADFGVIAQVLGVRVAADAGAGGAVVEMADGSQRAFAVGREIAPGIVLAAVSPGAVSLMAADGRTQVVALAERRVTQVAAGPRAEDQLSAPHWLAALLAQPHERAGDGYGWRTPATVPPAAARAGLQPGDVILAVNGHGPAEITSSAVIGRDAILSLEVLRADGSRATLMVPRPA